MNYKNKLILLTILLETFCFQVSNSAQSDAELYVSGDNVLERIEGTISNGTNGELENKDHHLDGGKTPIREAVWAENGATVHNLGTVASGKHKYTTQFGVVLGIGGINNKLVKEDTLVRLKNNSSLYNEGTIKAGAVDQKIEIIIEAVDTAFYRKYADYTKNVITANDSTINNYGTIKAEGDNPSYITGLSVSLLKYNDIKLRKNVLNMAYSNLVNKGNITYERDANMEVEKILDVSLLDLGVHYNRDVAGVLFTGKVKGNEIDGYEYINTIKNEGEIFVGGDFITKKHYSGIGAGLLGLDIATVHNKYGIKAKNADIENSGKIIVERDFTYGKDTNGDILRLELIKNSVLDLGLLSFKNVNEKSVGVFIDGGVFKNNSGTIDVGVNKKDRLLQIYDNAAIAVQGDNEAQIEFNGKSSVILEGTQVWLGALSNRSKMELNGETDIIFRTRSNKDSVAGEVNKDIFGNDGSGTYVINGIVNAKGETLIYGKNDKGESEVIGKEEFDTDITISKNSNLDIGVETKKIEGIEGESHTLGQLNVSGKLNIEGSVDITSDKFVGADLTEYIGDVIFTAKGGITGDKNIDSGSFIFEIKTDINDIKTEIYVSDITRKNFNDIVLNKELGNIFETSYNGANEAQLGVYRLLAQGENQESFNKVVDEVTGKDTLTTLPAQIYDITRDLNGQFKDFAKNNRADGVVFKYINSKSELDANSSTVGFDRKSSGIMVGYNNNLSEKLRLGAGFSYMTSDIDYTSNSKNKITTWNARGYSDYDLGFANMFNDLSFAYNQSENKRMADQLSYTGMKESDTDVYTLSLNNSLYKEYKFGDKLTLVPSLNLDFTYIWQDAIKEDGAIGASAKKVEAFYGTLGAGVDGKYNLLTLENSKLNLVGGIDYAYDIIRETDDMSLQVSAFDPYYKENLRELDKKYLDLNVGLNYEYKDSYSVGVKYTKELINDVDNDQFAVDFTYKF
ncbi:autotransporter outer membrane beta-barrel domain-containing protein [uncultured Fusobacterium sp.]|uniref:autotransporter outer membrane beta-barrel domain-containing protein n=1 Tax=uncultured Fusobacterium sp. TaxID=159267 RepID=UPI0025FE44ED|nr:autotransporter outer membrane beta-barrel domain-containing protein [uncultured Fusobacterium sp.]